MAIGALIVAILGLIIFSWLGPALGTAWAGGIIASSAASGEMVIVTWPVWVLGLGLGAGIPLVAVLLGLGGLRKGDMKGVAVAGLVMGIIGMIFAIAVSAIAAGGLSIAQAGQESGVFDQNFDDLQKQLDDPALQKQLQEQLKKATEEVTDPGQIPAEAPPAP